MQSFIIYKLNKAARRTYLAIKCQRENYSLLSVSKEVEFYLYIKFETLICPPGVTGAKRENTEP